MLTDGFGRRITYLRLSVTDRCDFRCVYCMPRSHRGFVTPSSWLTPGEIERVVRAFARLGLGHVRLTGGEPLVRRELTEIARRLAPIDGIDDLSLSTNAARLERFADGLRASGVGRINVSLDSLDPETFRRVTGGNLDRVMAGLDAADAAGFQPVKINTVVMRGINDTEVEAMAELCLRRSYTLRFIETMPVGDGGRSAGERFVDLREVRDRLDRRFGLAPAAVKGSGPASYYRVGDSGLVVGFITPMSRHFCATCNRVRLSVDGDLYLCLGQEHRVALAPILRSGIDDAALCEVLERAVLRKPERHDFTCRPEQIVRPMSALGG